MSVRGCEMIDVSVFSDRINRIVGAGFLTTDFTDLKEV